VKACLLPVIVYNRLGASKPSVHHWVVRALQLSRLVVTDDLALPDQSNLICDVDVEADAIINKAMGVSDQICYFMS
jgi:hypothetical protein